MILAALLLAAASLPCGAIDSHLPRDLAGWTREGRSLDTGHAVTLPAGQGHGAETSLTIRKAGIFGIAVDSDAWVDVYRGKGKPLALASESRGPRCSSIRKILRFRLAPGSYRVAAAKVPGTHVKLMLIAGDRPWQVTRGKGRAIGSGNR